MPVLPGSTDDVVQFAPVFPAEVAKKAFLIAFRIWLAREAERLRQKRMRAQQLAAESSRRAWQAYSDAMWAAYNRRREMSFGQQGLALSGQGWPVPTGGGIGGASDWVDVIDSGLGAIIEYWKSKQQIETKPDYPTRTGPLPWENYMPGNGIPSTVDQTAASGLFRLTAQRITPLPELSLIGPDGKCHTWLHARPKGWKINKAGVTGRTRRCCRKK
jgi:hypothetical protein